MKESSGDRRLLAAANNAAWCDVVCRTHGLVGAFTARCWAVPRRSPELYPDAVTLVPGVQVSEILALVEAGRGCSVKDSFADLDLALDGFERLFEATWIWRDPSSSPAVDLGSWSTVHDPAGLGAWAEANGSSGTFRPALLADTHVDVLACTQHGDIVAGAVLNGSGTVTGISNLFVRDLDGTGLDVGEVWRGAVAMAARLRPGRPLVGYERGETLAAALAAGFDDVGPLQVWLRPG